jgi:hypothetical protein
LSLLGHDACLTWDADPSLRPRRQGGMATPELISLIVALILRIALLGGMAPDS